MPQTSLYPAPSAHLRRRDAAPWFAKKPGEESVDPTSAGDLNRFQMMSGTGFHRSWEKHPGSLPNVVNVRTNHRIAQLDHDYEPAIEPRYRRAVDRLLAAAHKINRKPLSPAAREFEGVM